MNDDLEELPDLCAEIQLYYMAHLISEDDPTRRYPEQWGHVQNCLSCLSTYLEARDWAAELSPIAQPRSAAWRDLLRIVRIMKDPVMALVTDVQGTLRDFPPKFQGPVILSTVPVGSASRSLRGDWSAPSVEERGTCEAAAVTVEKEGCQVKFALEETPAGSIWRVTLLDAQRPATVKVRLGEAETALAGVGAVGELHENGSGVYRRGSVTLRAHQPCRVHPCAPHVALLF